MRKITVTLIVFLSVISGYSQKKWQKAGYKIAFPVCYASDSVTDSHVPIDPEILKRLKSSESQSDISVSYSLFPANAKKAFEYAVSIWEAIIESPVTIYMQANWRRMETNVLGSCGPTDYLTNFERIPNKNRYYPVSVVEKITETEITDSTEPDIIGTFNRDIDWYYGTDGETPKGLYDLVSVALHEIGHGLGFTGLFYVNNENEGAYEYYEGQPAAAAFDILVKNGDSELLTNTNIFKNPSLELAEAFESGQLYTTSQRATAANNGISPQLYSPYSWDDGSSIYHLNDATFPAGDENSLMKHAFGKGESIHKIGPVIEGIMADIGWKNMYITFQELKDKEEIVPITFNVNIESDYSLDTSALYVIFSYDDFQSHSDTISLMPTNETGLFTAEIEPASDIDSIHYFISATDIKSRTYNKPIEAPAKVYTVKFGPDTEKPEIVHSPIDYYFTGDEKLPVSAIVDDNFGIDTVYIEYSINGGPGQPIGLQYKANLLYSGDFVFDTSALQDGDEVNYAIIAVDASSERNTKRYPENGNLSFKIEKILNPVVGYVNDFENSNSDFILHDFNIYQETGFENNALHSPHPYPSPKINDSTFNFTTILKHPVILQEDGMMSFDQVVLIEPGTAGTEYGDDEFWDFVIVEGSKDQGKTWIPLADGYDSREDSIWDVNYNKIVIDDSSAAVGVPEWYINKEINLLQNNYFNAGDTILIRFRLFSDPYANGWGWAIDNLRIQLPVSVPLQVLSPGNITIFPNPFQNSFKVKITPKTEVSNVEINLFNMFGQKIISLYQQAETAQFVREINMANYSSGIYLLSVRENGKQIFSKKIIKN